MCASLCNRPLENSTCLSVDWEPFQPSLGIKGYIFLDPKNLCIFWSEDLFRPHLHIGPIYLWSRTVFIPPRSEVISVFSVGSLEM